MSLKFSLFPGTLLAVEVEATLASVKGLEVTPALDGDLLLSHLLVTGKQNNISESDGTDHQYTYCQQSK